MGSAPAAKPVVPDHASRTYVINDVWICQGSCALPPGKGSASRGTRTASPALTAATDKGALVPAQMSKKYLAGARALVIAVEEP